MILIPAAWKTFSMGSIDGNSDELPVRTIVFSHDFFIDSTEVTQMQYCAVMELNPSHFNDDSTRPAELMTWFDAVLYCNALSKLRGCDTVYCYTAVDGTPGNDCKNLQNLAVDLSRHGYRLPTEAEWEYSCRANSGENFFWGNSIDSEYCWYDVNSGGTTHPVAAVLPNAFGLYDMSGNVWEWCGDWYADYDTIRTLDPVGPSSGSERVIRGGSWMSYAPSHRPANRTGNQPIYRSVDLGFRCVLDTDE
jgi:formylglycine-generating enzyme required for sulfatase activity